mgnify:CR=1 FL=1
MRSNATVGWDLENFGVSWSARYYSGVKEQCLSLLNHPDECTDPSVYAPWYKGSRNYNERGSVTFHDLQFRYTLPWEGTVSVGANNVFDKKYLSGLGNFDTTFYGEPRNLTLTTKWDF